MAKGKATGKRSKKAAAAQRTSVGPDGGAAGAGARQKRRNASRILRLERRLATAHGMEEKRRRQLERALEAVQVAGAKLAHARVLIDAQGASNGSASSPDGATGPDSA